MIFREDIPANVATLSSRITFRISGHNPDTRVLVAERTAAPVGMYLSITTPRGLALLGLSEGQEFISGGHEDAEETVALEKVCYQPEAAKKLNNARDWQDGRPSGKPILKVIRGTL